MEFQRHHRKRRQKHLIYLFVAATVSISIVYILLLWKLLNDKSDVKKVMENFIYVNGIGYILEPIQYRSRIIVQGSKAAKRFFSLSSLEKNVAEEYKGRRAKRKIRTTNHVEMDIYTYRSRVKRFGFQFLKSEDSPRIFDNHMKPSDSLVETHVNVTRCGMEAQHSFILENLLSFPSEREINQDSVVLITGILSRVGFHLALKLATQCNVKVMIGIDAINYNEYGSNFQQLQQIKLLYTQARQLKKPLLVAFDGINPKQYQHSSVKSYLFNEKTGDFDLEENTVPTHVLHVLSSEKVSFNFIDPGFHKKNGGLFLLRQSLTATEQLLATLGASSDVHFTFVSSSEALNMFHHRTYEEKDLFQTTKLMEEIMIYYYSKRLPSSSFVILRVPTIYGPWGRPGSFDFDSIQKAMVVWNEMNLASMQLETSDSILLSLLDDESTETEQDILFVDDAITAIVTGMQYESPYSNIASFNLLSGEKTSAARITKLFVANLMHSSSIDGMGNNTEEHVEEIAHENDSSPKNLHLSLPARKTLNWSPRIILRDGLKQLLAWYLDENLPFGPLPSSKSFKKTSSQFLRRQESDLLLCHPDDVYCLAGRRFLPCASECSDPNFCLNSAFDYTAQAARQLSENCEIVLYSAFLSDHTTDLDVVVAPETNHHPSSSICSIAFLLESSVLANDLRRNHADRKGPENAITYKGWDVILINMQQNQLSRKLRHLLKLSPRNFFHSTVKAALYIPPNFPTKPEVDDILFTTGLLHRLPLNAYSNQDRAYHREMEQMNYMVGKSKRDALIILPSVAIGENPQVQHVMSGSYPTKVQKVSIEKGLKSMIDQSLWNNDEATRNHVEFEKDIANIFNNPSFVTSQQTPTTAADTVKFSHRHWTRKHWIVHNFEKLDAQNLRCDWYLEQIQWEDDKENISFAHILARMEVERFHKYASDEEKSNILDEQNTKYIDLQSDEYQWSIVTYPNSSTNTDDIGYVRILDDRALMIERKLWQIRNKFTK